jgi:hypothetical protein
MASGIIRLPRFSFIFLQNWCFFYFERQYINCSRKESGHLAQKFIRAYKVERAYLVASWIGHSLLSVTLAIRLPRHILMRSV